MMFKDNSDYFDSETDTAANAPDEQATPAQTTATAETPVQSESAVADADAPTVPRPRHRFRNFMLWVLFIAIVAGAVAFYIRYCNPYAVDAHESGLVVNVEKRGIFFKTYESEIALTKAINNPASQYSRQAFSFANDSLAHVAQHYQQSGHPVMLTYSRYFGTLPWRGASLRVITAITPEATSGQ